MNVQNSQQQNDQQKIENQIEPTIEINEQMVNKRKKFGKAALRDKCCANSFAGEKK